MYILSVIYLCYAVQASLSQPLCVMYKVNNEEFYRTKVECSESGEGYVEEIVKINSRLFEEKGYETMPKVSSSSVVCVESLEIGV